MPRDATLEDRTDAVGRSVIIADDRDGVPAGVQSGSTVIYDLLSGDTGSGELNMTHADRISNGYPWNQGYGEIIRDAPTWGCGMPTGTYDYFAYGIDCQNPHTRVNLISMELCFLLLDNPVQRDIGFAIRMGGKDNNDLIAAYARIAADQQTMTFGVDVYEDDAVQSSMMGGSSTYPGPVNLTWHWLRCKSDLTEVIIGDGPYPFPYMDRLTVPMTLYPTQDLFGVFYRGPSAGLIFTQFQYNEGEFFSYAREAV